MSKVILIDRPLKMRFTVAFGMQLSSCQSEPTSLVI